MRIRTEALCLREGLKSMAGLEFMEKTTVLTGLMMAEAKMRTQFVVNRGENVPNAYFLELPEYGSIFYFNPLTGDIYITIAGIEVGNAMHHSNLADLSRDNAGVRYQMFSSASRLVLAEMVDSVKLDGIESPFSCLDYLKPWGYPRLQKLLLGVGVRGEPGSHQSYSVEERNIIFETESQRRWIFLSYRNRGQLSKIVVADSSDVVGIRSMGNLSLADVGGKQLHTTEILLDQLKRVSDHNPWPVEWVHSRDGQGTNFNDLAIVGVNDELIEAFPVSADVVKRIKEFETPAYPWKWPE